MFVGSAATFAVESHASHFDPMNSIDNNGVSTLIQSDGRVDEAITMAGLGLIGLAAIIFLLLYLHYHKKFKKQFTELSRRIESHEGKIGEISEFAVSPGQSYALASRGPTSSRDAEYDSASARWQHLSLAFPHLNSGPLFSPRRDLILVSREYTPVEEVKHMQDMLRTRVRSTFEEENSEHRIVEPDWINTLGENFDALRHPQLAIASPAIYTFPFYLTWQRRHLWGVLPYARHSKLGVIVRDKHPMLDPLQKLESEYRIAHNSSTNSGQLLWSNDPRFADWLRLLVEATLQSKESGVGTVAVDSDDWSIHESPTVFSVGAYLHKEILPLTCATIPNPHIGANYANHAREIDVLQFKKYFERISLPSWHDASAIIVDLALTPRDAISNGWKIFSLPHCVYVPIGIGYSVATIPFLRNSSWRNDLLRDAGEMLRPASSELAKIGIDLDRRLWNPNT